MRWSVSGGAPLGARLGHFFRGIGITVLEGYGLTETCAGVTLNLPARQRIGSVGRPIPGCTIRIADDGEVLIKGGNVFTGYWRNDEATQEVFDADGWFHSGDLGELDDGGYLTIIGRKKDLIITSSGKNVAPAVLEDRLRAHWLVSQCVVVGDARPFIGALITIDADAFQQWKQDAGKPAAAGVADLRADPQLLASVQEAVDDANTAVSAAPRRSRPSGCWTPTSPRRVGSSPQPSRSSATSCWPASTTRWRPSTAAEHGLPQETWGTTGGRGAAARTAPRATAPAWSARSR